MSNQDWLRNKDAWKNPDIYREIYNFSIDNTEEYWAAQIDRLSWIKRPGKIVEPTKYGNSEWFSDGKINACYNCVDRHAAKNPDKIALIWQSEDIDVFERITFQTLKDEVCRFANTLKKFGVTRNDYVTVYMPMVPEGVYACLACARLGIPYSAVFAGFAPSALGMRMNDCHSNFIISCDASVRRGQIIPLKGNVDKAREICDRKIKAFIIRRRGIDIPWDNELDIDYYAESAKCSTECEIEDTNSLSELFILYTSGSVGKPKGVVMGTGGFLLFSSMTHKYFFDIDDDSVFWGSGDIGWMGGHSYSLYAPLCNGVTSVIFEGTPTYPRDSIFWEVVDKHRVSSLNTAPTAIRAMMKNPVDSLKNTTRDSLKLIGVMGEILNRDAWDWYFNSVGKGRCPLINMWGQTELGGVPTAPLCNLDDMKTYGHVGRQFFGCKLGIMDDDNQILNVPDKRGTLFIEKPLPGMLLRIYGNADAITDIYYSQTDRLLSKPSESDLMKEDPARRTAAYLSVREDSSTVSTQQKTDYEAFGTRSIDGRYFTGDEAYVDPDGNYWITGRVDDVLNVSGHRTSPIEVEEVISMSEIVAEVSVVGFPHPIKGEGIYAFVVLKQGVTAQQKANAQQIISDRVKDFISPITKPDVISIVNDLPKTRSGKIMRRILRKLASGDFQNFEDMTTISNPECINEIVNVITIVNLRMRK
ncbi:MAG: AMP-binding protein [Holosporales bacterium]|jgi:acetyl-CoA synthetase|nr:AMP-binding protein [Holosporales bacterium]